MGMGTQRQSSVKFRRRGMLHLLYTAAATLTETCPCDKNMMARQRDTSSYRNPAPCVPSCSLPQHCLNKETSLRTAWHLICSRYMRSCAPRNNSLMYMVPVCLHLMESKIYGNCLNSTKKRGLHHACHSKFLASSFKIFKVQRLHSIVIPHLGCSQLLNSVAVLKGKDFGSKPLSG